MIMKVCPLDLRAIEKRKKGKVVDTHIIASKEVVQKYLGSSPFTAPNMMCQSSSKANKK